MDRAANRNGSKFICFKLCSVALASLSTTQPQGEMAMNHASILDEIKNDAWSSQWENGITLNVIDYGKRGDRWTVDVSGDVDIDRIEDPRLMARASEVADNGFCKAVETYVVNIENGDVESMQCTTVVYSPLEAVTA